MIFQTLDDKKECVGIYCDNDLHFDEREFPNNLTATWGYAEHLRDKQIEYASLYLEGKKIADCIPEYLRDDWEDVSNKLTAFQRSLVLSRVDLRDNCIYDLVPRRFLIDMCEVKNDITKYVLYNHKKPDRYDFSLQVCKLLESISNEPLKINKRKVRSYLSKAEKNQLNNLENVAPYIKYNQFGTVTGRLTTKKESFPILTLKKSLRDIIEPHNDYFLEMDFNGAEARVMLGLLDIPQPEYDIHEFHSNKVFGGKMSRDKVKQSFFAWLYGSRAALASEEGVVLSKFYEKGKILSEFWDGTNIKTTYKKEIKDVDAHHALNYVVQSTAADLTLLQSLKIDHLLRASGCKTRIACIIHDAIVLDFHKDDEHLMSSIKKLMESTKFGSFKINLSKGKNLGNLKEVKQ